MDHDGDAFWFQPPTTLRRRPPLLNPVVIILVIPVIALLILFFVVPPFISLTNQILRPNSVKKSWDSLNILLVLFAILCGIFARRNDDPPPPVAAADDRRIPASSSTSVSSFVSMPRQSEPAWMDFPDRREFGNFSNISVNTGGGRLRRSSSSYPDLRQESVWESGGGDQSRARFFDDFDVNFYRSPPSPEEFQPRRRRSHEAERREDETLVREVPVDKFEVSSAPPPPTPPKSPTPPPAPPPPPPTLKRRRSLRSVPRVEIVDTRKDEAEARRQPPPPAPPPPPPPAAAAEIHSPEAEEVSVKIHRRKSGTKEFATAIASLYKGQRKRKKRVKSRNIYDSAADNSSPPSAVEPQSAPPPPPPPLPPPPPPPPPPPSNVLHNLFKKSGKSKRVHSIPTTATPPPPPPPPPNSIFNNLFKTGSISKRFMQSTSAPPPPPPPPPPSSASVLNSLFKTDSKSRRFKNVATSPPPAPPPPPSSASVLKSFKPESKSRRVKNVATSPPPAPPPPPAAVDPPRRRHSNTGKPPKPTKPAEHYHESVIIAPPSPLIPLPPPPPPFRVPEVSFVARGDYVRIRSTHSSRCSSPDLEDVDVMSVKSDGGDSIGPSISCPSPDVNMKADSFIARLRDEWRLEKMNSARERRSSG